MARSSYDCVCLVATKNLWELLTQRALPSISRQSYRPEAVILVNDGQAFNEEQACRLREILGETPLVSLTNERSPGAAGSWNTGLAYLHAISYNSYVAILDDDDAWDPDHLQVNLEKAIETGAELIVSGLRRVASGVIKPRSLPSKLRCSDFYCGNPGLQGSNTFVSFRALERAGGFTDGLPSLNDRDLAVRLLQSGVSVAYTGKWTATWYHDSNRQTLSTPRSIEKIVGLQVFWRLHSQHMSASEQAAYLERAWRCFGVTKEEIVAL